MFVGAHLLANAGVGCCDLGLDGSGLEPEQKLATAKRVRDEKESAAGIGGDGLVGERMRDSTKGGGREGVRDSHYEGLR